MSNKPKDPFDYRSYCREGAHPSILVNNRDEMTVEEFVGVLKRIRSYIEHGGQLIADDSNEMGNKYAHCTWGICSDRADYWPDPALHVWPKSFVEERRVEPIDPPKGATCPMQTKGDSHWGCFYSCRVFQRKLKTPTQEEALALYDTRIKELTNE